MKKLTSIKGIEYKIPNEDLCKIKGGGVDYSMSYTTTNVGCNKYTDESVVDMCWVADEC